jgi:carboxyl-terminal processing protease
MKRTIGAAALVLVLLSRTSAVAAAPPPSTLTGLDIIELEIAWTTLMSQYYRPLSGVQLLEGARTGLVSYLKSRGVADPIVPAVPANVDRWKAEDAVVSDVVFVLRRYSKYIKTTDLIDAAVAGELASTRDPYTVLFKPQAYHGFVKFLDGSKFGGIGVQLALDDAGAVHVAQVFPASPAEKAGLEDGDVISTIDGKPAIGLSSDTLRGLLRGAAGTAVRLVVVRQGKEVSEPVNVVRAAIAAPEVTGQMLPGDAGYIRLTSFGAQVGSELDAVLSRLKAHGARSYVLDLRDNGGGYRDGAIQVASHFVGNGPIVSTQERNGPPTVFNALKIPTIGAPLAVLVNGDTASASEIVAGAIQDARAGTIVGVRTFGKGLVQEAFPLPDGAGMKLTVARYFTPSGRNIEGTGITPDVVLAQPNDSRTGQPGSDPQLDRALQLLQAQVSARGA